VLWVSALYYAVEKKTTASYERCERFQNFAVWVVLEIWLIFFLEKNMNNVITLMLENNQRYDLAVSMYVECVISSCVCRLIWPNHILIVAKPQWGCSHPGFSQAWTTVNRQVNWMRRRDVSMPWVSRELHRAKIIFPPSQIKLISRVVVARKRNVCNSALPTG
jgi:hypothetical protein